VHEFGVAAAVLDTVETRAADRPIRAVRLRVGVLQRLDRAVFDDAFAMLADGGVADGAAIEVVDVAVEVRCRSCGVSGVGDELITECACCGGHDLELLAGDDLVLESITLAGIDRAGRPQEVG
jgi:hydrogenase nickel incorporation protein HypA/HybF